MKTTLLHYSKPALLVLTSCILLFSACSKNDDDNGEYTITGTAGVYMLNEGAFGKGNSEITYYNIATGVTEKSYYTKVNGTALGETANDLQRYGSKMYCVVSGIKGKAQSFVDVMDVATCKTIKRIPFNIGTTDGYLPRYIAFYKNKAYVSRYDGKVSRIDTASLAIDGEVTLTPYLEGLAVANGKLYIANSDYTLSGKNTVSVIDLATFAKTKDITVTTNPVKVAAAANGDVYVVSYGNYSTIAGNLDRISSTTDTKISTTQIAGIDYSSNIATTGAVAYVSTTDASTFLSSIKNLNLSTGALGNGLVTDGTSFGNLYGLTINAFNNDVYAADAVSYTSTTGKAICFGADGKKKFSFETGQNPQHAVFNYNYQK